ncbi:MAG: T9SS type A sorting domain-containing protein, partial [Phaeodactylibacter sp.]|nr:T9SS type A sorting domain-containing protein [Phaeodactylibacter sp.]
WQEEAAFQLSAAQENRLSEIAYSQSPSRAYARSLLNLLTGADFEPDEVEWEEPEPGRPAPTSIATEKNYAAFPNPASGEVLLAYPASEQGLRLQVIHLPTSRQETFFLDGSGRFAWRTSGFPSGVYLLRFVKNGEVLHQEKAVVVK